MQFQEKIKKLRVTKGLTQAELAEKAQLSIRTIQRLENGENIPYADTRIKILEVLAFLPDKKVQTTSNNSFLQTLFSFFRNRKKLIQVIFLNILLFYSTRFAGLLILTSISFVLILLLSGLLIISLFKSEKEAERNKRKWNLLAFLALIISVLSAITILPYKSKIESKSSNGEHILIERNEWTGKTDTIIEKIN